MFILKNTDPVPLYKQLYNQIRACILSGKLPAGSRLPSVRDLSVELSASRNTVDGAYQELLAEGYIYSKQRSGYFVSALDQDVSPQSLAGKRGKSDYLPGPPSVFTYDFHPARLNPESFPTELWRKCFVESLRRNSRELVQYGDLQGDWGLRCSIQSYLEQSRGVLCDPEQIVICAGLQQSLEIVSQILKDKHSAVAVENPGYHLPRSVFLNHSYTIVPVPVGPGGLDLNYLRASTSTIAYVTPSHQLPMGYVMPVANRLALIEWAESGDKFIIEDDYDSELRYYGKPIPSLQGLRPAGNIIYSGTFSKILSPALRLSYLVLPYSLLAKYRHIYRDYFPSVPLLEQRTMANFMEQGHWERHIRRMRIIYKKRHNTLLQAIEHYFGARAIVVGQGAGLHVVLILPDTAHSASEIVDLARQKSINLFPVSDFYVTGQPEATTLLLGFGRMNENEIVQGIALLSQICSNWHQKQKSSQRQL
jgi:GntR family transcriptional regulator / MocR family aminotransferase